MFEKVVDSDTENFKDFIESIVDQYPPGYQEAVHVHYYDGFLMTFPEVKTDHDLLSMFHKHTENKVVDMAITYTDPLEPYIPITEWPVVSNSKQNQPMKKKESSEPEEDNYLANPLPENEYVDVDEESTYLESWTRSLQMMFQARTRTWTMCQKRILIQVRTLRWMLKMR